jgi:nitrite reductase/ring-hydroxylating ferredoxin subunit
VTGEPQRNTQSTRRGVLAGVGLVGLAGAVSACSSGGSGSSDTSPGISDTASAGNGIGAEATALATTSEIPVGGGKVFATEKVVVTQPDSGDFKAFSAVCTHMGCLVNQVADGTIDCPCHGSKFSIKNGAVVGGPAPSPLPAESIKVAGSSIVLA